MNALSAFLVIVLAAPLAYVAALRIHAMYEWSGMPLVAMYGALFGGIASGIEVAWPFANVGSQVGDGWVTVWRLLGLVLVIVFALDLLGRINIEFALERGAMRVEAGHQAFAAATQMNQAVAEDEPHQWSVQADLMDDQQPDSSEHPNPFVQPFAARVPMQSVPSAATSAATSSPARHMTVFTPLSIAWLICGLVVIAGSFAAWVRMTSAYSDGSVSFSGTEYELNGKWTAILGVVAVLLILSRLVIRASDTVRLLAFGAAGCFAVSALLAAYHGVQIERGARTIDALYDAIGFSDFIDVGIGAGLIVVIAASIVGFALSLVVALNGVRA